MKVARKFFFLLISLLLCSSWVTNCTCMPPNQTPPPICGKGWVLTQNGCQPKPTICEPACQDGYKCEKGKCVPRDIGPNPPLECDRPCGPNEVCKDGRCVAIGCSPPCNQEESCVDGTCVPKSCSPPCLRTGYICKSGRCERICVPECAKGLECQNGVCLKPCAPCQTGEFCRDGKCVKREDADGDNYPSDRDCDDKDKTVNPGALEVCDGKDNDCDGVKDNIAESPCYTGPGGSLGKGICRAGVTSCKDKKEDCRGQVIPTKEICDGKDNDCDGLIDNHNACSEIKPEKPQETPKEKPGEMPKEAAEMPKEMPKEKPGEMPHEAAEKVSPEMQDGGAEKAPEMAEPPPEGSTD